MRMLSVFSILFCALLPAVAAAASPQDFPDVPPNSPFYEAVHYVQSQGIVSGYPDGNFLPDRFINRAEFTKIVIGATFTPQAWQRCDPNHIYSFSDAGRNEWYSPYLCVAVQSAIINGYPNGSFMPSLGITFVEAAKILVSADRIDEGGNIRYDRSLPQVDGEWYAPFVKYLANRGAIPLVIGSLDQNITRTQMAEMIYRLRTGITDRPSRTLEDLPITWR
ncbi:MAG: S-layer homology domain-containing protein [Candidatus Peribacter sp.]|nr:S-layer homology domain-containing protein [Candidatus Peribacter sp.]